MNYQKFIVFVISMLTVVALGVTLYYFMKDEEVINLQTSEVSVNVGDKFKLNYLHENALDGTKIEWDIINNELVSFDESTNEFTALKGGETEIILETNRNGWRPQRCLVRIGDGSEENPFMVSNADQLYSGLATLSQDAINSNFKLIADIDLKNDNKTFSPLFNGQKFAGNFNGNNHTISNLKIESDIALESAGLFYGIACNGKVHNLTLENVFISGNIANVGAVAGLNNGIIEKIRVNNATLSSTMESKIANIGSIAGTVSAVKDITTAVVNYAKIGRVDRCQINNAKLIGYKESVIGGIVANLDGGTIINSAFAGLITTDNNNTVASAIVANMSANANQNAKLKDNYAIVEFDAVANKAGIVNNNDYSLYLNDEDKVISENIIWGQYFVCEDETVNAIVNNGYTDSALFEKRVADKILVAERVESEDLKTKYIYSHTKYKSNPAEKDYYYDFSVTWEQSNNTNNGYPTLKMLGKTEDGFINVNGTIEVEPEDEPIIPSDPDEPDNPGGTDPDEPDNPGGTEPEDPDNPGGTEPENPGTDPENPDEPDVPGGNDPDEPSEQPTTEKTLHEILTESVNSSEPTPIVIKKAEEGSQTVIDWKGNVWTPIGTDDAPFNTTLDGQGCIIKNITISSKDFNDVGIFGVLGENAVIKNITFENVTIAGGQFVGIVAGKNLGLIENVTLNSNNKINISTNNSLTVGGFVGLNKGSIKTVISNIEITVSTNNEESEFKVGGVAGENYGYIYDVVSTVNINSSAMINKVGGIVGNNENSINFVAYKGSITTKQDDKDTYKNAFVGGIAGYNVSDASIELSSVQATLVGYNVGGIVGLNQGNITKVNVMNTTLKGKYVGGLTSDNSGRGLITDCSVVAKMEGNVEGAIKAGFTTFTASVNAKIERCFVSATFMGTGKSYAETSSIIRQPQVESLKSNGYIVNCIYDDTIDGNALKQGGTYVEFSWSNLLDSEKPRNNKGTFFGSYYNNVDGRTSTDNCKNSVTPFTTDNRNFDNINVWLIGEGDYPIVRGVKTI